MPVLSGTEPWSRRLGWDRGRSIDRHLIDAFIGHHAMDMRGRVLEIGDAGYVRRFGGPAISRVDVLNGAEGSDPDITLVGDLQTGAGVPEDAFDLIVLTQTLHLLFDFRGAVASAHRALREGGVVLATLPGIAQVGQDDMEAWGEYWRFTSEAAERLFSDQFGAEHVEVSVAGNVRAASAFLYGLAIEEMPLSTLERRDPGCEQVVCIRAQKIPDQPPPVQSGVTDEALPRRPRAGGAGPSSVWNRVGGPPAARPVERDTAIERHFFTALVARWADDLRGQVLEIGAGGYAQPHSDRLESLEIIDRSPSGEPEASVLAALANLDVGRFDCVLVSETLEFSLDGEAVLRAVRRAIKPGGIAIVLAPGIAAGSPTGARHQLLGFTELSMRMLAERALEPERITLETFGNVLLASAFLEGRKPEELPEHAFGVNDPAYQLGVAVRVKTAVPSVAR